MGQEELMNKIAELEREIIEGAAIFADIYASSGMNYNADTTFSNSKTAEEYIDTAIAKNIQHSLKMYQYGGYYPA